MSSEPPANISVLPPDWIRVKSSAAAPGKDYYFNTKNKKSVWTIHEALLPKNNRPPNKAHLYKHQEPRPPADPEHGESSGSDEPTAHPKKPITAFPKNVIMYPNSEEMMYNQRMWMQNNFNPQFMPFNSAMSMMPPNPWGFPMFANPMNTGFNQFAPVATNPNMFPVASNSQQGTVKNVQEIDEPVPPSDADKDISKSVNLGDLRHKIEAKKRLRRNSTTEEAKPIRIRRSSCPDEKDILAIKSSVESLKLPADLTDESMQNVGEDPDVPLTKRSYGYWLLKQSKMESKQDVVYICVDTNIFITKLDLLDRLVELDTENICRILVPQCVTVELDTISKNALVERSGEGPFGGMYGGGRPGNRRRLAKTATDYLLEMFEKADHKFISDYNESSDDSPNYIVKQYNTDDGLINCCLKYMSQKIHTVLLTEDKNLRMRAISCNVSVYSISQIEQLLERVQEEIEKRDLILKLKVVVPNTSKTNSRPTTPVLQNGEGSSKKQNDTIKQNIGVTPQVCIPSMFPMQNAPNFGSMMFQNIPIASNGMPIMPGYGQMGFNNLQLISMPMSQPSSVNVTDNNQTVQIKQPKSKTNPIQAPPKEDSTETSNNATLKTNKTSTNKGSNVTNPNKTSADSKDNETELNKKTGKKIKLIRNRFNDTKTKQSDATNIQMSAQNNVEKTNIKTRSNTLKIQRDVKKINSPNDSNKVSASSASTHYPSFTTTSARSKEIVNMSLESSVVNDSNEEDVKGSKHEDLAERAVIFSKLYNSMEEWTTQLELNLVETLTGLLLSEERLYKLAPLWSLYDALIEVSKRCCNNNTSISEVADRLADIVDKSYVNCMKSKNRKHILYKKLSPKSPEVYLSLYWESRKLLSLLKKAYSLPEINECEVLLEQLMDELKGCSIDNEIEQLTSPTTTDEMIETAVEEDCEDVAQRDDKNKRILVLQFLKQHFAEWRNYDIASENYKAAKRNLQDEEFNQRLKPSNKPKPMEKKSEKVNQFKTEENANETNKNATAGPVIIRNFSIKIPEFESRLNEIETDKDWDCADEEEYDNYDEENDVGDNYEDEENYELDYEDYDKIYDDDDNDNGKVETSSLPQHEKTTTVADLGDKMESDIVNKNNTEMFDNLSEEMDFEYDEILDRVEPEPLTNGFSEEVPKKKMCPVAHAMERCISNCFAFASEQFKLKLGLQTEHPVTGDADGLPHLPDILEHILIFAQCLEELLNSRACDARLLRSCIAKLAPKITDLPKLDKVLMVKSVRLVEKVPFDTLKREVNFLQETHSVLTKFYRDHF